MSVKLLQPYATFIQPLRQVRRVGGGGGGGVEGLENNPPSPPPPRGPRIEPPLQVNDRGLKTQAVNFQLFANSGGMENKFWVF